MTNSDEKQPAQDVSQMEPAELDVGPSPANVASMTATAAHDKKGTSSSWFSGWFGPSLPEYPGPYPVGMLDVETPGVAEKGTKGVLVRFYYPTTNSAGESHCRAKWLPKATFYSIGYGNFSKLPTFLALGLVYPALANIKTWGWLDAPLRPAGGEASSDQPPLPARMPPVIFCHGLGGMRTTYSTFCGGLASEGFIVAAIEHRDGSATVAAKNNYKEKIIYRPPNTNDKLPTESVPEFWSRFRGGQMDLKDGEVKEVIQLFRDLDAGTPVENLMATSAWADFTKAVAGRFDFDNWVMAGHSFGAATALMAMQDPSNPFKCGIAIDPFMYAVKDTPVTKPFISIQSQNFHWRDNLDPIRKMFRSPQCSPNSRFGLLRNTAHQDISDFPALFSGLFRMMKLGGAADPRESLRLYHAWHMQFLKENLTNVGIKFGDYPGFEKGDNVQRPEAVAEGEGTWDILYRDIKSTW